MYGKVKKQQQQPTNNLLEKRITSISLLLDHLEHLYLPPLNTINRFCIFDISIVGKTQQHPTKICEATKRSIIKNIEN